MCYSIIWNDIMLYYIILYLIILQQKNAKKKYIVSYNMIHYSNRLGRQVSSAFRFMMMILLPIMIFLTRLGCVP